MAPKELGLLQRVLKLMPTPKKLAPSAPETYYDRDRNYIAISSGGNGTVLIEIGTPKKNERALSVEISREAIIPLFRTLVDYTGMELAEVAEYAILAGAITYTHQESTRQLQRAKARKGREAWVTDPNIDPAARIKELSKKFPPASAGTKFKDAYGDILEVSPQGEGNVLYCITSNGEKREALFGAEYIPSLYTTALNHTGADPEWLKARAKATGLVRTQKVASRAVRRSSSPSKKTKNAESSSTTSLSDLIASERIGRSKRAIHEPLVTSSRISLTAKSFGPFGNPTAS